MKAMYVQQPEDISKRQNNSNIYQTRSRGGVTGIGEGVTKTSPSKQDNLVREPAKKPDRDIAEKANQNESPYLSPT